MTKKLLIACCTYFIAAASFAQSKDEIKYKERAAEIKQEITTGADPAFQVKDIPEKYKNESAVIIARSFEVTNSAKRKFKMVRPLSVIWTRESKKPLTKRRYTKR